MDPKSVQAAISNAVVDLSPYFSLTPPKAKEIADRFTKLVWDVEKAQPSIEEGEFGGAWLWLLDNTSDLARALLMSGRLRVSKDGRYLADLKEFDDGRSLSQREDMIKVLSAAVEKEFKVECGYFSVLNSDNFNDVPFYASDHLDNRMFYNVAW
jgi:hypothetical protein